MQIFGRWVDLEFRGIESLWLFADVIIRLGSRTNRSSWLHGKAKDSCVRRSCCRLRRRSSCGRIHCEWPLSHESLHTFPGFTDIHLSSVWTSTTFSHWSTFTDLGQYMFLWTLEENSRLNEEGEFRLPTISIISNLRCVRTRFRNCEERWDWARKRGHTIAHWPESCYSRLLSDFIEI